MTTLKPSISAAAVAAILACVAATLPSLEGRTAGTPLSKRAVLDSIAKRVLLPGYTELATRSTELEAAVDALASAPTLASLKRAQEAWSAALLAWRRTQAFAHGPIADLNVYSRVQFWPSRRQSVERVLRAGRPITDDYIQELGANAVGLSALEVMLFDVRRDDAARVASLTGAQGERPRQYLRAIARELVSKTRLVADAWQSAGGFAAKFGGGGQDAVNLLVNDVLAVIENGAQTRLRIVIDQYRDKAPRPDLVEGALSGTSQQGVLALLTGAHAAFSGGEGAGLDDYLTQVKSSTARRIETQFQKAIAAVGAIGGPLELAMAARPDAVTRAHEECRALEIMLKTEVVSTLGVTLTFKATDGD